MFARVDPYAAREIESTSATYNGVMVTTRTIPAEQAPRGGDWCDAFLLSDDILALSIGDVCGRGSEAFERMLAVRQAVRDAAHRGLDPARTLLEASKLLGKGGADTFATAIFALLDSARRTVTLANAGHPAPFMVSPGEARFLELPAKDLPLGVEPGLPPAVQVVEVSTDVLLVFYTNGVTERERDVLRGATHLRDAVLFAYGNPDLPSASVIERQMNMLTSNRDDAAILTARVSSFWRPRRALSRSSRRRRSLAGPM
jgi:serine phosphatase RsbU (regulator of sigma subunit)